MVAALNLMPVLWYIMPLLTKMKLMKKYILVLILIITAFYSCNNSSAEQTDDSSTVAVTASPAPPAVSLPAFKMVDLKSQAFNLADFKGKKVFVNLWAAWCPPCRAEIPSIERLYSKVDKTKTAFVMLSLDDEFTTAVKFAFGNKITTPVFYPAENLPALFNVPGIPATFIFDEKGNIIKRIEGGDDYDTAEYLAVFAN